MLAAKQNDSVRRHGCIRALHMISKRNLHPTKIREEPFFIKKQWKSPRNDGIMGSDKFGRAPKARPAIAEDQEKPLC